MCRVRGVDKARIEHDGAGILGERPIELPLAHIDIGAFGVGEGLLGIELDGAIVVGNCEVQVALLPEHFAAVVI
ncbi:MAG: hypothetical protein WCD39_08610, partial [Methyloceanibacter sp.]